MATRERLNSACAAPCPGDATEACGTSAGGVPPFFVKLYKWQAMNGPVDTDVQGEITGLYHPKPEPLRHV